MPPPGNSTKKKKKGRAPKHQNTFAFKHNPGSKKTEKILSSPNVGVCKRCYDKIEWRKKYRKVCVHDLLRMVNIYCQMMCAYHTHIIKLFSPQNDGIEIIAVQTTNPTRKV